MTDATAHHDAPRDPSPPPTVSFEVRLRDGAVEAVEGADAYHQEQSMTTFFRTDGRQVVDCWSVRVASIRTDQILSVRRCEAPVTASVTVLRTA
jgi:hypothetical protein